VLFCNSEPIQFTDARFRVRLAGMDRPSAVQSSPQSNGRTTRSVERVARSISQAFIRRPYQALPFTDSHHRRNVSSRFSFDCRAASGRLRNSTNGVMASMRATSSLSSVGVVLFSIELSIEKVVPAFDQVRRGMLRIETFGHTETLSPCNSPSSFLTSAN